MTLTSDVCFSLPEELLAFRDDSARTPTGRGPQLRIILRNVRPNHQRFLDETYRDFPFIQPRFTQEKGENAGIRRNLTYEPCASM